MGIPGRQIRRGVSYCLLFLLPHMLGPFAAHVFAKDSGSIGATEELPDFSNSAALDQQGQPETPQQPNPSGTSSTTGDQKPSAKKADGTATPPENQQPKRILGLMPNFRAVSAGEIPPPPTPKEAFVIATKNSFDYSSFVFVGITSLMAEGTNTHSQLGKGVPGYGRYYWRGLADKTIGNYMVIFALPTVFHQDERYYAMGKGGFLKRLVYSSSRVVITPNYDGHPTFNVSELMGRGIAQGISLGITPARLELQVGLPASMPMLSGVTPLRTSFANSGPTSRLTYCIAIHEFLIHCYPLSQNPRTTSSPARKRQPKIVLLCRASQMGR